MKRNRANSTTGMVEALVKASKGAPAVPKHVRLREGDIPFWDGVIRARAYDEWTECDLVIAAQLARTQADIEREQATLDAEGTVTENQRGTPIANPRVSVLENLARREMALMRSLRMAGRDAGDPRDEQTRRRMQKVAEQVRGELESDDLLAL